MLTNILAKTKQGGKAGEQEAVSKRLHRFYSQYPLKDETESQVVPRVKGGHCRRYLGEKQRPRDKDMV